LLGLIAASLLWGLQVLSALRVFGKKKRMPLPGATPDKRFKPTV
jgi:hypothetical protein